MSTPTTSNNVTAVPQPQPTTGRPADLKTFAQRQAAAQPASGPRPNSCTSQVSVGAIKQTSHKVVTGSNGAGSDYRKQGDYAKQAVDNVASHGGPREPMGQAPCSSRLPQASKPEFESTPTALDSDSGV